MLRVMLIDENRMRRDAVSESLHGEGYHVMGFDTVSPKLIDQLSVLAPDIIVIDTESPDRDTLEYLTQITRDAPRPVVMFTDDDDAAKIRQALRAGVTSYVVGSVGAERIQPILRVAAAHFEEHQTLVQELDNAKTELASRKVIERAKGIVMRHKGVPEDEAYRLLREMAMTRRVKLVEVAQQVIDLSSVLS